MSKATMRIQIETSSRRGRGFGGQHPSQGDPNWHAQFGDFAGDDSWQPAMNCYQVGGAIEICLDLAGIDKEAIDVRIEPGRLSICGRREPPQPPTDAKSAKAQSLRILDMEIDHGHFRRDVPLPRSIDLRNVTSQYRDGLLWVRLPLPQG